MTMQIGEGLRVASGFVNQSIVAAKTTNYVDITGSRHVACAIFGADAETDATCSVQFKTATDSSGSGATNYGDAIALESAGVVDFAVIASKFLEGIPEGHKYIAATVVETGSPSQLTAVSAMLLLGTNRYNP